MSDHPDIEKLPLSLYDYVEGTLVREVVREVVREIFRDPNHGTPDNITPVGCLALARKGYRVWNAWREVFPVRKSVEVGIYSIYVNHAQFQEVEFREELIFFSNFHFGDRANFRGATWGNGANFQGAEWGDWADFKGATWGKNANFRNVKWGEYANFQGATWDDRAIFEEAEWGNFAKFQAEMLIRGARWGDGANFQEAHWGNQVNFEEAHWGNNANFEGAEWGHETQFQTVVWGEMSNFVGAQWGDKADFRGAQWGDRADFRGAQWGNDANFQGAEWGKFKRAFSDNSDKVVADFRGAQWGDGANFQAALWKGAVDFSGFNWEFLKNIYSPVQNFVDKRKAIFEKRKKWAQERGLDPTRMRSMDFSGAHFDGEVIFQNRTFTDTLKFSRSKELNISKMRYDQETGKILREEKTGEILWEEETIPPRTVTFKFPPRFHGSELHQDTSFEGAIFPPPSGKKEDARAYRTLKLAFSKQQAVHEERRFFRLEMREESKGEEWRRRGLYWLYWLMSDYGFSLRRPFLFWTFFLFLFAGIYGMIYGMFCDISWRYDDLLKTSYDLLKTSLIRSFPLSGLERLEEARQGLSLLKALLEAVAIAIHKVLSFALFFLAGLALRNRFKIK